MTPTTYQKPEIRDANDNIIQQGAFGKNTALANATNDGWIDYVANDLEFLYDLAKDEVVPVPSLPASGQTNKTYLLTTTGVSYRWSGTEWVAVSSSEAVGRAESAANLAEQWATKTSGSVDGTEYSAKYYAEQAEASADDAQDTADDMADHLAQIDKNTGGVAKNSKRISNIEKLLQGNLYDYDTDDDVAYTKTVPSGALPYAGVEKLGGKTLVWNQLADASKFEATDTINNVTFTNNEDGTVTVNGTASADTTFTVLKSANGVYIPNGHIGLLIGCPSGGSSTSYRLQQAYLGNDNGDGVINTSTATAKTHVQIKVVNGTVCNNLVFKPQSIDLTFMFGSGNEPSTVVEFEAMFPADYYPYNAGTLLSAGVTSVVSKDSNDVTLQTLSIPAEVRALEGYGWSAGTAYNYIDFERKVFVKRVGAVDFGSLEWTYYGTNTPSYFRATISDKKDGVCGAVCSKYIVSTGSGVSSLGGNNGIAFNNNITSVKFVHVVDSNYTDATTFTSAMNGVMLYYELATPIETDISQYLTDNLIEVGAGGTLTFSNSNGDDYHIPVPSTETYMIDLQEAISNG